MDKFLSNRVQKVFIILTLLFSFIIQVFIVPKMPLKYFADSLVILEYSMDISKWIELDNAYLFIVKLFYYINVFNFSSFLEWQIVISIISSLIFCIFLFKIEKIRIDNLIYVYMTSALLNIYVYRIGKDIIQLLIFNIIFAISFIKIKNFYKIILISGILCLEAIFFRYYYFLIALVFLVLHLFYKCINRIDYIKLLSILFICLICGMSILKFINIDYYYIIFNLRNILNDYRLGSDNAITMILNCIPNVNIITFSLNYIFNIIRLFFPFELLIKGNLKYILFIIYQLFFSVKILKIIYNINNYSKHNKILIILIMAYLLVSNLYEPDFGSLLRHEISLSYIYIYLFCIETKKIIIVNNNNLDENLLRKEVFDANN